MPILLKTSQGVVTGIWGSALIRGGSGKMRLLKMGEVVHQGDHILTTQSGYVQVTPIPDRIAELELPPTSAGLGDNGGSTLGEAYRVDRIAENLLPAALDLSGHSRALGASPGPVPEASSRPQDGGPGNQPPTATSSIYNGQEDAALPVPIKGHDNDGAIGSVTVTNLPGHGTLFMSDRTTPVTVGVPLTPDQAAGLVFVPAPDFNGSAKIDFTVTDDAGQTSAPGTIELNLLPVNDAPVLDLDRNNSSGAPDANYLTTFTENGAAVAVVDRDVSISDIDSTTLGGAVVTLTNAQPGDVLHVGSLPSGITATVTGTTVNLAGTASVADYEAALRAISFSNSSEDPSTTPRNITVTVNDGDASSNIAVTTVNVISVNDAPVAADDSNTVQEDGIVTLNVNAAQGVIHGPGRDTDVDGSNLQIVSVRTGPESGNGHTGSVGTALAGTYGTLTLHTDGSYDYVLDNASGAVQNLHAGEVVDDVFTYVVSDGQGGTDTATLRIHVDGAQDFTAGPPTLTPVVAKGLSGSYYGYNDHTDNIPNCYRTHSDDGQATFGNHLAPGNLNSVEDLATIIDGRNQLAGGSAITGTPTSAQTGAADVVFNVSKLDYGFNPPVSGTLGSNGHVAPGSTLPAGDGDAFSPTRGLSNFLGPDHATAVAQVGAGNTNDTSGLGTTTDAILRFAGQIYMQPGAYDFRVTADDGFRFMVAGQTLLEYDGNQWPTPRIFTNVPLGDLGGGLQTFELLYWEQSGESRLRVEYKPSGDPAASYQVMSLENTALFSNENAPILTDTRIQDLVYDANLDGWQIRTGSKLDGDAGDNILTGGISRDFLDGGDGNDELHGNGGADHLAGGAGNDVLDGGDGSDFLIGGAGADSLTGGKGDDTYRLSDGDDSLTENAGEGTDTIQLDDNYVAAHTGSTFVLPENFENLLAEGSDAINLTGNAADNRLEGNAGANVINGDSGNDFLIGGGGNDILTGGLGSDVFAWRLADAGPSGKPAVDTITDFNYDGGHSNIESGTPGVPIGNGDVLDLRDLLQGEHTTSSDLGVPVSQTELSNLLNFIDVEVSGGNTTLHISSTGGFAGGAYNSSAEDSRIVLQNVDLYQVTGTAAGNESSLFKELINHGTLIVD